MSLYIVRHGETALNAARVLQPADTPLSARGFAQARAVAQRLAGAGLAGVVSSDQPRALQTAEAVARACGLAVQVSPLLQERHFGALRGRPYDTLGFDPLVMEDAPQGGESMLQFLQRADAAWAWVLQQRQAAGGPLAVVTHGLVAGAWLGRRITLGPGVAAPARVGNTALTVCAAQPPHLAAVVACMRHLQGETAEDGSSLAGG